MGEIPGSHPEKERNTGRAGFGPWLRYRWNDKKVTKARIWHDLTTLKLVNNYLDPKGIFIFDLKTVHFFRDVAGESVFGENLEDCSYIWENYFDNDSKINEYALTLFLKDGDTYKMSEEIHYQRGYGITEIKQLIKRSGMDLLEICDAEDYGPVRRNSERIYVMARERGKTALKPELARGKK